MNAFEGRFVLFPRPQIEDIGQRRDGAWLRISDSGELLALARFAAIKGDKQPKLVLRCERDAPVCALVYHGFRIGHVSAASTGALIHIPEGAEHDAFQLTLTPGKTRDSSGKVISCIETLKEHFPMDEYTRVRADIMRHSTMASFFTVPRL